MLNDLVENDSKGNQLVAASMADSLRISLSDRDVEQAITSLKKGSYLLKYGRRGKPKFCPFQLTSDESALVWYSGKEEKQIKLSQVLRIVPGQRTPTFKRYPRPEKEYQSFSLICPDRSLDLVSLHAILMSNTNQTKANANLFCPISPTPAIVENSTMMSLWNQPNSTQAMHERGVRGSEHGSQQTGSEHGSRHPGADHGTNYGT